MITIIAIFIISIITSIFINNNNDNNDLLGVMYIVQQQVCTIIVNTLKADLFEYTCCNEAFQQGHNTRKSKGLVPGSRTSR